MKKGRISSRERFKHILESIANIQQFTEGVPLREFENDMKVFYACLYQFAVIGEAVINIDDRILKKYNYPWYKVKSFRNFIMHEYHSVDERVVWDTIKLILPGFKQMVEQILEEEFS